MFERLFKKQDVEVKLEEVPEYLSREFASQMNDLEVKLKSYAQEIRDIFQQVETIIDLLATKTSANTYANTVKQRFCAKASESIALVKSFSGSNKDFIKAAHESMHTIGELNLKDFRHLHSFRDEMTKTAEKMKLLDTRINYASKAIASSQSQKIEKIISRVSRVMENRSSISSIEHFLNQVKETSIALDKSIADVQQKLAAMNMEFTKYAEDRIKLRTLEQQQHELEQHIDNEFSGLSRVMKKFLYYGDLTKAETRALQDYIKDAGMAFLSDADNVISSILDKLYAYRDRTAIEMNESKHEKVKDLIRHMKILQELRQKYEQLEKDKKAVEAEFENRTLPIVKEIRFLNSEMSDKQRELGLLKSRMQSMQTEKQTLEREILTSINSLEFDLSEILSKNVKITR
jgi:chromosome segregation ATPase